MIAEIMLVASILAHELIVMTPVYHFASMAWYLLRCLTLEHKVFSFNGEVVTDYRDAFFVVAVILQCAHVDIRSVSFLPFFVSILCGYQMQVWVIVICMTMFTIFSSVGSLLFLFSCYCLAHASGTRPATTMVCCALVHLILAVISPMELEWIEIGIGIFHTEAMIQSFGKIDLHLFSQIGALGCGVGSVARTLWCYIPTALTYTYFWNADRKVYAYMPVNYSGLWFILLCCAAIYVKPLAGYLS